MVWALSLSLATTQEIIVIFSSSAYLDVSVRQVRSYCAMSSTWRVSPFGNPRIESHLQIPAAYRSLSRPSSPPRAKASPVYSLLLSSTRAPFAPHGVLFCSCHDVSYHASHCWWRGEHKHNSRLLLFALLFNFFQYVKELSLGGARIKEQGIKTWSLIFVLSSLFTKVVENNGVEPLTSCVQGRRSSQLS